MKKNFSGVAPLDYYAVVHFVGIADADLLRRAADAVSEGIEMEPGKSSAERIGLVLRLAQAEGDDLAAAGLEEVEEDVSFRGERFLSTYVVSGPYDGRRPCPVVLPDPGSRLFRTPTVVLLGRPGTEPDCVLVATMCPDSLIDVMAGPREAAALASTIVDSVEDVGGYPALEESYNSLVGGERKYLHLGVGTADDTVVALSGGAECERSLLRRLSRKVRVDTVRSENEAMCIGPSATKDFRDLSRWCDDGWRWPAAMYTADVYEGLFHFPPEPGELPRGPLGPHGADFVPSVGNRLRRMKYTVVSGKTMVLIPCEK
jgi:hypothetical protein